MTGQDQWDEPAGDERSERDAVLDGEVYDWYQRGLQLYEDGNPAAASQLLVRAASRVPRSSEAALLTIAEPGSHPPTSWT